MKLCLRLGVVGLMVLSMWRPAEAARISVSDLAAGGGTIVNDGTQDVSSSDGSSHGNSDLMSALGLSNGDLAADLAALTISGGLQVVDRGFGVPVTAELSVLRVYGTLATSTCADCLKPSDVNIGSSLSLRQDSNGNPIDPNNVLFAFNIVGPALSYPGWSGVPTGLPAQTANPADSPFTFRLSNEQIAFILARMGTTYGVDAVRISLGAGGFGLTAAGGQVGMGVTFDMPPLGTTPPPIPAPEPGTLTLLAAGLAMAGIRRLKKSAGH